MLVFQYAQVQFPLQINSRNSIISVNSVNRNQIKVWLSVKPEYKIDPRVSSIRGVSFIFLLGGHVKHCLCLRKVRVPILSAGTNMNPISDPVLTMNPCIASKIKNTQYLQQDFLES